MTTRKDIPVTSQPRGVGASGFTTGAGFVRAALRSADWKAYAAANGLSGNWSRARRYGKSPKELHALYLEQRGCCYLCGDPLPKNLTRAVIEHDHTCCPGPNNVTSGYRTSCGKCVRGISCTPCNQVIASAQDDPGRLRRIADKLEAANRRVGRHDRAPAIQPSAGQACRYDDCQWSTTSIDNDGYHDVCRHFARIKGVLGDSPPQAQPAAS